VGYITATTRPLNCLIFLLPVLVLHQVGLLIFTVYSPGGEPMVNAAFAILSGILSLFGPTALYVPGLVVVGTLFFWHVGKGYPWEVRGRTMLGMAIESFLFAWPALIVGVIAQRAGQVPETLALSGSSAVPVETLPGQAVLMIGAGIYEELLFRLALISLIALLLTKVGNLPSQYALMFAAVASALLFGAYHFSFGQERTVFNWPEFIFYFVAGVYFTGLYVFRGFGITVGAHIVYDLIVLFLPVTALG
jgi:membrane protease YdiL (CAAX protease family)